MAKFLDGLISHYVFDDGKLVVAHAGLKESMQGRGSAAVRDFALYGETTGETDDFGLPVRYNWSADYRGKSGGLPTHSCPRASVAEQYRQYRHRLCLGGSLTALRYPEREIISVRAHATYYESRRPFLPADAESLRSAQHTLDDVLDLEDVIGKRIVDTRLVPRIRFARKMQSRRWRS